GRSLGVNNIPPKLCTYSCAYCQVGPTMNLTVDRAAFYRPREIVDAVERRLEAIWPEDAVDYVTFVPDGEPTLDVNLGESIELLKPLGIPVAVITNTSLIWQDSVRDDLELADWVSLKVDAVDAPVWRRVNRPHRSLDLSAILDGAVLFSRSFRGTLATETMIVAGANDAEESIANVAGYLDTLRPSVTYLSIPTRPPAEPNVRVPDEASVTAAYQAFARVVDRVEYLTGYEGNAFASTGDASDDLRSITAVHPLRRDAVAALLRKCGADWDVVEQLVAEQQIIETKHNGHTYYTRRFRRRADRG
ncbi:MAG: radical SAM protein, partial [Spirochaetota bacterium]